MSEDPQIRAVASKSLCPFLEDRSLTATWKLASKAASFLFSSHWGLRDHIYTFRISFFGGCRELNCFEKGISQSRMSVL